MIRNYLSRRDVTLANLDNSGHLWYNSDKEVVDMTHKVMYKMKLHGDGRLIEFLQPFLDSYVEERLTLRKAREFKAALKTLFGDAVTVQTASCSPTVVTIL